MCHWENAYATTPHSAFVTISDLSLMLIAFSHKYLILKDTISFHDLFCTFCPLTEYINFRKYDGAKKFFLLQIANET